MNKLYEITMAWITSVNPNEVQKNLAEERLKVCNSCEHAREVDIKLMDGIKIDTYYMCGHCGCPIRGKVFTPKENGCPLGKWEK